MRTDCRHWSRRTTSSGDVVESCELGAAPDAPRACPADCVAFEKRTLSTVGFEYGSLHATRHAPVPSGDDTPSQDELAVLAALEELVQDVAGDVHAAEAERRRAEEKARERRRRRPPRKRR